MRRSADGWVGVSDAPSMAPSKTHAVNPGTGLVTHVGLTKQGLVRLAVEPSAVLPLVTATLVPIESKSLKHNSRDLYE